MNSKTNQIKQVFISYFDKQDNLIRKIPENFYKYDDSGNKIIEIMFIPNIVGINYQYELMNYDNKNNLKTNIVFNGVGRGFYDFGKIIEYDNTVSFSKNETLTNEKYINKYNNKGQLLEVEIHNLRNDIIETDLKRTRKLLNEKYYYSEDRISKIESFSFNYDSEEIMSKVVQFRYDEDGIQIEKIEIGEYLDYYSREKKEYKKVEETSIYFDDNNIQVKEIKNYENDSIKSKTLQMRDKIEYYWNSDSNPFKTKEIGYKNELKKIETIHGQNLNNFEEEYYKRVSDFIYEESKYFEDKWLKLLIKKITDLHDDWDFNNWYN